MQIDINNEVHLGQKVTPFESIGELSAIVKQHLILTVQAKS